MAEERKERLFKAKLCEQTERFDDMVKEMNELVNLSSRTEPLTVEERNLLSVAYKNVVGSKRSSWRVVSNKLEHEHNEKQKESCTKMKAKVEEELNKLCSEILGLLTNKLIPSPESDEARIFFLKMKGDYYRYMVEICDDSQAESKTELTQKSEDAYKKALETAKNKIECTNPIRLGLALNYSVFLYEIKANPAAACELAKSAFDEAIPMLDGIPEESYKDTTLILQLLRDNLTLWTSELEDNDDQDVDKDNDD